MAKGATATSSSCLLPVTLSPSCLLCIQQVQRLRLVFCTPLPLLPPSTAFLRLSCNQTQRTGRKRFCLELRVLAVTAGRLPPGVGVFSARPVGSACPSSELLQSTWGGRQSRGLSGTSSVLQTPKAETVGTAIPCEPTWCPPGLCRSRTGALLGHRAGTRQCRLVLGHQGPGAVMGYLCAPHVLRVSGPLRKQSPRIC